MFLTRALFLPTLLLSLLPCCGAAQSPVGRSIHGRFLVTYRNGVIPSGAADAASAAGANVLALDERLGMAVFSSRGDFETTRRRLSLQPDVELVVEDRVVSAHVLYVRSAAASPRLTTSDPDSLLHSPGGWAVRQVGGFGADAFDPGHPGPWDITRGRGVRIAILDSGIDAGHPDLTPNLALNLSEIDQTALPSACDDGTPQDQQGHGTWAAALAAGALGPGTGLTAGVAPEATLLNIKVLERLPAPSTAGDPSGCNAGQASGLLSWVIQGIDDAVANRADIISLSLGTLVDLYTGDGAGVRATFDHATHAAFSAGVLLVAAAGNDGLSLSNPRYLELPAQARDVLAVVASTNPACAEDVAAGALCARGPITLPYYSNFGPALNALAAPGGSYPAGPAPVSPSDSPTQATGWIFSACSSGKPGTLSGPAVGPSGPDPLHSMGCFGLGHIAYVEAMGTSASAPLAAGVAALIRAAHPTWSAQEVLDSLRATADLVPGLPAPLVDAASALAPWRVHANPILAPGH